jgi:hypothetical protein
MIADSISYTLMREEPREVWKCTGACGRFRHRTVRPGILPAICCGQPARLWDRYSQPIEIEIEERVTACGARSPESA